MYVFVFANILLFWVFVVFMLHSLSSCGVCFDFHPNDASVNLSFHLRFQWWTVCLLDKARSYTKTSVVWSIIVLVLRRCCTSWLDSSSTLQSALAPLESILPQEVPPGRQICAFLLAGHHSGVPQHSHNLVRALQPAAVADRSAGYVCPSRCTSPAVTALDCSRCSCGTHTKIFLYVISRCYFWTMIFIDWFDIIICCTFLVMSHFFRQRKQEVAPRPQTRSEF